jgi:hypothetical protein
MVRTSGYSTRLGDNGDNDDYSDDDDDDENNNNNNLQTAPNYRRSRQLFLVQLGGKLLLC